MVQVAVTEALAELVGPALEFGRVHFHGGPTATTGEVVVVRVHHATPVEAFAPVSHHDINFLIGRQFLQLGVDRRERHRAPVARDDGVEFLGANKALHPGQRRDDVTSLLGVTGRCHNPSLAPSKLLFRMIPIMLTGMVLKKLLASALGVGLWLSPVVAGAGTSPVVVSGVSQWGALAAQVLRAPLNSTVTTTKGALVFSLLTDPNADPHDHEATAHDAELVARATLVIENGAGYDSWLQALVKARGLATSSVMNVGTLAGVTSGKNPHLFYDPRNALLVTHRLVQQLGAGATPGASATLNALNTIQSAALRVRQACAGVKVSATEDVATDLLSDMGLKVITPESFRLAVGNNVDPSIGDLATTLSQLGTHPAFLIDNTQTQTPLTAQVVSQAAADHVKVIKVTETMTGSSYTTWLASVVRNIETALKAQGCLR